jgi:hypothetical protein
MHIVSGTRHMESLRQFEALLTSHIPDMGTAHSTYSNATGTSDESSSDDASLASPSSANIMATFVGLLEAHNSMQVQQVARRSVLFCSTSVTNNNDDGVGVVRALSPQH